MPRCIGRCPRRRASRHIGRPRRRWRPWRRGGFQRLGRFGDDAVRREHVGGVHQTDAHAALLGVQQREDLQPSKPRPPMRHAAPRHALSPWGRGPGTHIPVARGLRVPVQSGAIRVERGAREVVIGSGNLVRVDLECAIHSLVKHKRSAVRSDRDNATVARRRRNRKADEPVRPNGRCA